MSTPTTKAELDERIQTALDRLLQAIAPLTPTQMQAPTLPGGWSVKDVLAHLAWWDNWLLYTIRSGNTAHIPRTVPALFEKIPSRDHWADGMNGLVYEHNRQRSLAEIQAEFAETRLRLWQFVQALTEDDIFNPNGLSAEIGKKVGPLVLGIYEHYEEHAHEIELANR